MKAIEMIAAERERQIKEEGFDAEHDTDDLHQTGELAMAACYYAWPDNHITFALRLKEQNTIVLSGALSVSTDVLFPRIWNPCWAKRDGKPRLRQLVVAGALIAAEIDRLLNEGKEQ